MPTISKDEFDQLVSLEERLAEVSMQLRAAVHEAQTTRAPADRPTIEGVTEKNAKRLLDAPAYRMTLEQIAQMAWRCGYRFEFSLVKVPC